MLSVASVYAGISINNIKYIIPIIITLNPVKICSLVNSLKSKNHLISFIFIYLTSVYLIDQVFNTAITNPNTATTKQDTLNISIFILLTSFKNNERLLLVA